MSFGDVTNSTDFQGAQTLANVARAQWADVSKRLIPASQMPLIDALKHPDYGLGLSQADKAIGTSFDTQRAEAPRDLQRMGIVMTQPQQAQFDKQMKLNEASATAGAENAVRTHIYDRNNSIMGGGMGTLSPSAMNPMGAASGL